jgi:putative ABC transport system substrate-binding protein
MMMRREFLGAISGGVLAWPLAARAQKTAVPMVGLLSPQSSGPLMANRVAGFLQGLSESQYVEGQDVTIEYRWAEGQLRPSAGARG